MPRKVVILLLAAAALVPAGCSTTRPDVTPPEPGKTVAAPKPAPRPTPRAPRRPAPPPAAAPASPAPAPSEPTRDDLASLIKGQSRWTDGSRTALVVTDQRGPGSDDPVPLFRQAIVIASVRSAVAGSPAAPEAAFRNGQLTLAFRRGSPSEVAAAVNRALAVPEVTRLVVVPPAP